MTLIVNGTLQSEFLTMFWPIRFTYSVTTESVMNLVLFSISEAYILPILISESVEYQFPSPRPPMSRLPTALTSSTLPGLTLTFWLPGSMTFSGLTLAAGTSPATGMVPGLQVLFAVASLEVLSLDFLSFLALSEFLSEAGAGVQSAEESLVATDGLSVGAGFASGAGSFEVPGAGVVWVSPGTVGWAVGLPVGGVLDGGAWGVDCAQTVVASANANATRKPVREPLALKPLRVNVMTSPRDLTNR